ncbi:MAG: IgGFc-binding protein [Deltaproteobacteria bacterium]|nr:IgGFc-binding protein [Deltaproteobacteria bacterium]
MAALAACAACAASGTDRSSPSGGGGGTSATAEPDAGEGGTGFDGGVPGDGGPVEDPASCEEAAEARTYVGCDFWPTVTANAVWSIFDFAVVVANAGEQVADVAVTRGGDGVASAKIAPNALGTLYLPWVPKLKGLDSDECGSSPPLLKSQRLADGAYHLTSSVPVSVYQFNALEYAGQGGPPNKSWAKCPGKEMCPDTFGPIGCFSFSNDASLLLPSTALGMHYRVTSRAGQSGSFVAITGTENETEVTIMVSKTGSVLSGSGLSGKPAGSVSTFLLQAGEVVQAAAGAGKDLSGTLLKATKPIQVLAGMPCVTVPAEAPACDHVEESVFPAQTLGQHYLVARPTGPGGAPVGHEVHIYGNADATGLSYPAGKPKGAPASIDAGAVVDLGIVEMDFEIKGDQAFAVGTYLQGGSVVDPGAMPGEQRGDPSQSLAVAVEQYRRKYIFLAPVDYEVNYVDVIQPLTAKVTLDGAQIPLGPAALGNSGFGLLRLALGPGVSGAHVLAATEPVGIQVVGYGKYTSYQYPGGLDLRAIAPAPVK